MHEIPSPVFRFRLANPILTLSLMLTQTPLPQLQTAYIVLHVQKLRTCLQIRTTKAERFGVETHHFKMGNGQKRELPVLFGQKQMYPKNNSGRECCWPYLVGQHPLSPVFGQKRPVLPVIATLLSFHPFLAILCSVFGHFMFLSGGLLDYSNRSTWATRTTNSKISPR